MIKGIGIDIIEIDRVKEVCERQSRFPEKILTDSEMNYFRTLKGNRRIEFLAGRFSAKEAFSKANGTGIGKELSFHDMEITSDNNGRPFFVKPYKKGVHLSITHSRDYAAAQVIIEE
ncbi:holo-ACP synthase [Heyndrickxia ginsengihumi]|uniref:Holo-[acyl-carrier-protein] synthase n=1 Tax=Heyndrickxia ginsengihumi TaxID=363870 RepID=A0A0A6XWT0_9BACI|nr:holo-ACP synthase [Heyndrickxia ginsengihumi]KHD84597.1 4'-phosphopantetheinyl transferase [Heyndrickxia ginsengihumi]MBE6184319.1 holo-ACP synthase [Bacillus sp. (in: firmicutes)]MCM3024812.1 holo-ACP synthase [Heyndrickxia ginsengihumi]NEY21615.1 holo-ACP synthase [Heyndrickxia ginsengihumi]